MWLTIRVCRSSARSSDFMADHRMKPTETPSVTTMAMATGTSTLNENRQFV